MTTPIANRLNNTMNRLGLVLIFLAFSIGIHAQKLAYSLPDRTESKQTNFEIIGQYGDNYLIYKNVKNQHYISEYNSKMELVRNEFLQQMPDKLIDANFVAYPEFSYVFYQYYQKGIVYCMAIKISSNGKALTQPIELDTTVTRGSYSAKVYQVLYSENKEHIQLLKINNRNEKQLIFKTKLYDKDLTLKNDGTPLTLGMSDRYDFLTDFSLDNDGDLVFGKGIRQGNLENITKFSLLIKPAYQNAFVAKELLFDKNYSLDEVKLKLDNYNNRYLFTGFYYASRRSSIEGIANAIFDKKSSEWIVRNTIPLGDEIREDAPRKQQCQECFSGLLHKRHQCTQRWGVFGECRSYISNQQGYNPTNRWNMMNPFMSPLDYYRMPGMGYGGYGNSMYGFGNNNTRYNADNIMILAFDNQGKMILSNFIFKTQFDDNNENMVGYQMINTGDGLQYLYNDYDRKNIMLTFQTLTPQGRVVRNPYIKNAVPEYNFIPRFAKQVDQGVVIIPCLYRNYICFARLEFDEQ